MARSLGTVFERPLKSCIGLSALFILISLTPTKAAAHEYDVKAAYLYQFTRFIHWHRPLQSGATFQICLYGENPFGESLRMLDGKKVQGHALVIEALDKGAIPASCRIVFFSRSEADALRSLLQENRDAAWLSVSDAPAFALKGGAIAFHNIDDNVRFSINLRALKRARLTADARLLELALEVIQ